MIQLILHMLGDYVLQSNWMAANKRTSSWAAGAHAVTYSLPFLLLSPSWLAFSVILGTHFLIDRFGLARYVVWAKNVHLCPDGLLWAFDIAKTPDFQKIAEGTDTDEDWFERKCPYPWEDCKATGYPSETPIWLATVLTIAADNTLHLLINWSALKWL